MRAIRLVAAMILALLAACAPSSQPPCGQRCQDDITLREQFAIPKAAHLIAYSSQPEQGGWFGREGLKLELVYQLNQSDYQRYQVNATLANGWHSLPITQAFLERMVGLEAYRSRRAANRAGAENGYDLTDEQLMQALRKSLPEQPMFGFYQVRATGNQLMRSEDILIQPYRDLDGYFMLALLDPATATLTIKVSSPPYN